MSFRLYMYLLLLVLFNSSLVPMLVLITIYGKTKRQQLPYSRLGYFSLTCETVYTNLRQKGFCSIQCSFSIIDRWRDCGPYILLLYCLLTFSLWFCLYLRISLNKYYLWISGIWFSRESRLQKILSILPKFFHG